MNGRASWSAGTALCVLGLGWLGARGGAQEGEAIPLVPGEPYAGELLLIPAEGALAKHAIEVPRDAVALKVVLRCGRADLDLDVYPEDGDETEALVGNSDYGQETVTVHRFSSPPLRPGRYVLDVYHPWAEAPIWEGERLSAVGYRLTATVVLAREDALLAPGEPLRAELDDGSGRFRTFRIEVPDDAPALRVDVIDTDADIDLFLRRGRQTMRASQAQHLSTRLYGRESLVVTPESRPPLRAGTWFLDVVDLYGEESGPAAFTLLVGLDAAPPASLLEIPPFAPPASDDPLLRALPSVVELFLPSGTGSGCIVGEDGRILTCAHVVSDLAGEALDELVVGVVVDPRHPSVERFRARVVAFDPERDLAVAQIVSGLYGQPLPAGYRFPAIERGAPDALRIGDPLWVVGYPGTGGWRSRVSVTATRGILAGFDGWRFGTLLKTDAKTHLGHSGGAALDAAGRLVGLPSFTIDDQTSELSYVIPVTAVPAEW